MEAFLVLIAIILAIYPYLLLVRLMRLACKALKKYTLEQPHKEISDFDSCNDFAG